VLPRVLRVCPPRCLASSSASRRSALGRAATSAFPVPCGGGGASSPPRPGRRVRAAIPLLSGTAQALTFLSEATTVSDHLLSTLRSAGHGTCTVDRKSTRLNSSHVSISYAVFCLKKK